MVRIIMAFVYVQFLQLSRRLNQLNSGPQILPKSYSHFFLLLFVATVFSTPAFGKTLYFVSLIKLKPGYQNQYETFLEKVAPVWKRHGMRVLYRLKVTHAGDRAVKIFGFQADEIAFIEIADGQNFSNYINDPNYRHIRSLRVDAAERLLILEGEKWAGPLGVAPAPNQLEIVMSTLGPAQRCGLGPAEMISSLEIYLRAPVVGSGSRGLTTLKSVCISKPTGTAPRPNGFHAVQLR